jgi:hypothetical protein
MSSTAMDTDTDKVFVIPTRPSERDKFLAEQGIRIMRVYGLQCMLDKDGNPRKNAKPLTPEGEREILMILRALSNIEGLTKETAKKVQLSRILNIVLDRFEGRRFRFPADAVKIAQQAFDKYELEGWGLDPDNEIHDDDDDDDDASRTGSPPPTTMTSASREVRPQYLALPRPNHPIYGQDGIMRGILVKHGKTTSYMFGKTFP